MNYERCELCPRRCGVNRTAGERGFCGCPDTALVAKVMLHKWEEPVLAGEGGSGAVFFGGCTLGCKYCQNRAISGAPVGEPVNAGQLRQIMENLIARGAENIDLVTPTQFLPTILPALEPKLPVPVVYNCGGYERAEPSGHWLGKSTFICRTSNTETTFWQNGFPARVTMWNRHRRPSGRWCGRLARRGGTERSLPPAW